MKELVIISGKGGTGKTSITGAFASLGEKMVLADCDVDAADLHLLLEPSIIRQEEFTGGKIARIDAEICTSCGQCRDLCRFEAITADFRVDEVSCEGCGVCVWNCPVDAISFEPRTSGTWFVSETRRGPMVYAKLGIAQENSGKLVTLVRRQARQLAEERKAELLLVDGPPGTGCPVIASIGGADMLLIIAEPSLSAIHDMKRVIQLAEHFQVKALVCINKCDLNPELSQTIVRFCQQHGLPVAGEIKFSRAVTKAQIQGKSVIEFEDSSLKNDLITLWGNVRRYL
jgi:MinD superfamily P-loop ATPase